MEIIEIKERGERVADFYSNNEHLIFHTLEYQKFIQEAFGCKYLLSAAIEGEEIKAVLPIVKIKSKLLGSKIISSAYLEYGGPAGDEKFVCGMIDSLKKSEGLSREYDYLEIRGGLEKFDVVLSSKLVKKDLYKRFVLELSDEEETWRSIQKSKRKAIKKAMKNVEVKEIQFSDVDELYSLYCRNMHRFGSPPYAKKYFESFYKNLVDVGLANVFGAYINGKLVSALLGFTYQDRVHILIAVSDPKYMEYRPSDAMHWTFIKWACNNGFKWFDFGRVREESGQFEYKRKWGPTMMDLPSYFLLWNVDEVPVVDPTSSKYKLFLKLWRFMPLWFTKLVGHRLRKGLGI